MARTDLVRMALQVFKYLAEHLVLGIILNGGSYCIQPLDEASLWQALPPLGRHCQGTVEQVWASLTRLEKQSAYSSTGTKCARWLCMQP